MTRLPRSEYHVGLGTNLGARLATLRASVAVLELEGRVEVMRVSRVYETAPLGPPQPRYLNAAVRVRSDHDPHGLLERLLAVERGFGRVRGRRWGPRTLDLDLLEGPVEVNDERLRLPHPELEGRPFVLAPLADVDPGRRRPSPDLEPLRWPLHPGGEPVGEGVGPSEIEAIAIAIASLSHPGRGQALRLPVAGWDGAIAEIEALIARGSRFAAATITVSGPSGRHGPPASPTLRLFGVHPGPPLRLGPLELRTQRGTVHAKLPVVRR